MEVSPLDHTASGPDNTLERVLGCVERNDWLTILEIFNKSTPDKTTTDTLLSALINKMAHSPALSTYTSEINQLLTFCYYPTNGQLKARGKKNKFYFLHLDHFPFPEATFYFLKNLVAQLPLAETVQFLDSTNPYPSRFQDKIAEIPNSGLVIIRDPSGSQHISVQPVDQQCSYTCHPIRLLCYPVSEKPGRHLGPSNFVAVGWATIQFQIEMEGLPQLQLRASSNFHLSFVMVGFRK